MCTLPKALRTDWVSAQKCIVTIFIHIFVLLLDKDIIFLARGLVSVRILIRKTTVHVYKWQEFTPGQEVAVRVINS